MAQKIRITLGLDDTDSPDGNCTTHLAFRLLSLLKQNNWYPLDFPRLIRNNPNIPFKTRGNGSVALTFSLSSTLDFASIHDSISNWLFHHTENHEMTNPGFVLLVGEANNELYTFAKKALVKVLKIDEAITLLDQLNAYYSFKGNGQGLIGALAAIGNELKTDHTYELLTYRVSKNLISKRSVDNESFVLLDNSSFQTFSSYDPETGRVASVPHGPDPVLYGIRGEEAELLIEANRTIKQLEQIDGWCIFRSNQGTDEHLNNADSSLEPYEVSVIEAEVVDIPETIPGGHVILTLKKLRDGLLFHGIAYEPSKSFRRTVRELRPEDKVRVAGGIRGVSPSELPTFNLERLDVDEVSSFSRMINPPCPSCNKRMESDGLNAGYKCKKCKIKDPNATKVPLFEQRTLTTGRYLPPIGAHRHLTRPTVRCKKNKKIYNYVEVLWSDFLLSTNEENDEKVLDL